MPKGFRHAYAIVRFDDFYDDPLSAGNLQERITVKKVVGTQEAADAEVDRLNALVAERGGRVTYFSCLTRVPEEMALG